MLQCDDWPCVSTSTTTRRRPWLPKSSTPMAAALRDMFGNASSVHHFGQQAKAALDEARAAVAALDRRRAVRSRVHRAAAPRPTTSRSAAPPRRSSPPAAASIVASAIEHEAVLNTLQGARAARLATTLLPVDDSRASSIPTDLASAHHRRHRARLGDAREQRDRHDPADRRAGRDRARARRAVPHRRRAVGRQDSGRRARARRRSAVAVGAQVQRPEGRRRAVDATRHAAASA